MGDSVVHALDGVDLTTASKRVIPDAHTIAELVPHITTWIEVGRLRAEGDWTPVTDEQDFPAAAETEVEWASAVAELQAAVMRMDQMLENAEVAMLDQVSPDGRYTMRVMLDGVVQHNLYHAGQIAVLKKG